MQIITPSLETLPDLINELTAINPHIEFVNIITLDSEIEEQILLIKVSFFYGLLFGKTFEKWALKYLHQRAHNLLRTNQIAQIEISW